SRTFIQDGSYPLSLIVTDSHGLSSTATSTVTVANDAPSIAPFAGATILSGQSYSASGSFTDAGADSWTATVNYGDGSGVQPLALSGKTFALAHQYNGFGTFTVTVAITDDHVTS